MENCVACGGFAHDTPGIYKLATGQSWPCGFCKGTGQVPSGVNWVVASEHYTHCKKDLSGSLYKMWNNFIGIVVVMLFLTGIITVIGAIYYFVLQ